MLFILTGQVQSGKTRWLETLADKLDQAGITAYGVITPGVWADRRDNPAAFPHADANGFEKLGIDSVLLPDRKRLAFARRADLALLEGSYDPESQSGKAKLGWHIDDEAIQRVNAHFATLCGECETGASASAGLLVIDELGKLELLKGQGLTQAVRALEKGPTSRFQHALVIIRESLLDHAEGRFGKWGEKALISPDEQSMQLVLNACR